MTRTKDAAALDPRTAARRARLRYVADDEPGIARAPRRGGFAYRRPDGRAIARGSREWRRIERLAIPPAWTGVWICPRPDGHVQATGRDARGRKQYRYHERWSATRDETRFDRMIAFARRLPRVRRRVARDLAADGLSRAKVLAAVVRLLEETSARIGNEEYRRTNRTFGLSTLRDRHVEIGRERLSFRFVGKGGAEHSIALTDRRLARLVRACQDLPGQRLFQYLDGGAVRAIGSTDVNDYIRAAAGDAFTAKDFRTWAGSVAALVALRDGGRARGAAAKRACLAAIDAAAERLRNTRAVCRRHYVHPRVLEAFSDGSLFRCLARVRRARPRRGLSRDEAALVAVLSDKRR